MSFLQDWISVSRPITPSCSDEFLLQAFHFDETFYNEQVQTIACHHLDSTCHNHQEEFEEFLTLYLRSTPHNIHLTNQLREFSPSFPLLKKMWGERILLRLFNNEGFVRELKDYMRLYPKVIPKFAENLRYSKVLQECCAAIRSCSLDESSLISAVKNSISYGNFFEHMRGHYSSETLAYLLNAVEFETPLENYVFPTKEFLSNIEQLTRLPVDPDALRNYLETLSDESIKGNVVELRMRGAFLNPSYRRSFFEKIDRLAKDYFPSMKSIALPPKPFHGELKDRCYQKIAAQLLHTPSAISTAAHSIDCYFLASERDKACAHLFFGCINRNSRELDPNKTRHELSTVIAQIHTTRDFIEKLNWDECLPPCFPISISCRDRGHLHGILIPIEEVEPIRGGENIPMDSFVKAGLVSAIFNITNPKSFLYHTEGILLINPAYPFSNPPHTTRPVEINPYFLSHPLSNTFIPYHTMKQILRDLDRLLSHYSTEESISGSVPFWDQSVSQKEQIQTALKRVKLILFFLQLCIHENAPLSTFTLLNMVCCSHNITSNFFRALPPSVAIDPDVITPEECVLHYYPLYLSGNIPLDLFLALINEILFYKVMRIEELDTLLINRPPQDPDQLEKMALLLSRICELLCLDTKTVEKYKEIILSISPSLDSPVERRNSIVSSLFRRNSSFFHFITPTPVSCE